MEKINDCSLNLERKNVEKLKNLFPEAVQEGVVNYDILKSLLGSEIEQRRKLDSKKLSLDKKSMKQKKGANKAH